MENRFPVEWRVQCEPADYARTVLCMEHRVDRILEGTKPELVWLLEHPPLYTAGTSARARDLIDPDRFPVHYTGRGGQFTYHGPGQRVCYVMMDLRRRSQDLRRYVCDLEEWVIRTLAEFGVCGERRSDRVGIWVNPTPHGGGQDRKIAAVGVRVRRWITYHGISVNVNPDLSHYEGIVPCGLHRFGVTSLARLGLDVSPAELDAALQRNFIDVFGTVTVSPA